MRYCWILSLSFSCEYPTSFVKFFFIQFIDSVKCCCFEDVVPLCVLFLSFYLSAALDLLLALMVILDLLLNDVKPLFLLFLLDLFDSGLLLHLGEHFVCLVHVVDHLVISHHLYACRLRQVFVNFYRISPLQLGN